MRVILAYDIPHDRRRTRLAKRLCGFLERVQYSVFEGDLSDRDFTELRKVVSSMINHAEDSVIIWQLCARCVPAAHRLGISVVPEDPSEDIIV